jgi:nitrite reductase (NADH) small subunit
MLPQSNWIRVTEIQNLPHREGRQVKCGSLDLALFNLGERVVAMENRCPHQHGPLADGIVSTHEGRVTVTCPLHTRRICVDSGVQVKPLTEGPCLKVFPAKVEDGVVMVDITPWLREVVA